MKKLLLIGTVFLLSCVSLVGCGKENYTKQKAVMTATLEQKYGEKFYVVDMARRATSDVNSLGDIYYAYVACDSEDEKKQDKGFYCEITASLDWLQDNYLDICLQSAIEGHFSRVVPEDAKLVGVVSTRGNEIISKYTYKNIIGNKIPFTVNVIIPVDEDMITMINASVEAKKFEKLFSEVSELSFGSINVVYCDSSYADDYCEFVNHLKPFNYKVKHNKIYADASLTSENKGDFMSQFKKQINNDMAAYGTAK